MADAAHVCGDPGIQYDSTINRWNPVKNSGRINSSNPCSEYMFLDDTACNLASLNLMTFLKNLALRRIEMQLPRNTFLRKSFQECLNQPLTSGVITLRKVLHTLAEIDKETAENINRDWLNFRPRIVFNQGRKPDDLVVIDQISETLERNLSLRCDYFGHLFFDPKASESLRRREPLKSFAPDSYIVADIDRLANRVIRLWSQPLRNSARLLKNNTVQVYEERYL